MHTKIRKKKATSNNCKNKKTKKLNKTITKVLYNCYKTRGSTNAF